MPCVGEPLLLAARRTSSLTMKSRQASAAVDIDLRRRRRLARRVDGLARTQQRLRRDARPVRALATDELALDDGDAQPALGQRARAVLTRRARAEDDDVVVAVLTFVDLSSD